MKNARNNNHLVYYGLKSRFLRAYVRRQAWKMIELANWKFIYSVVYL